MRLGFALPQVGTFAGPDALSRIARTSEELGYDTLWVLDRVLAPTDPQAPYPASADGSLPDEFKHVLDPVGTLTFVAALTSRVGLGTSILNLAYYNPVLLGRQLATLDVLSGGRLRIGLGTGWSPDEFEATGSPMDDRGARTDEALQALYAIWGDDPVAFDGTYFRVPPSTIGVKPVQKPHPPVYMAAYAPPSMRRIAKYADGWNPAGVPIAAMGEMFAGIKQMAAAEGRDPESLELVIRANVYFSDDPIGDGRVDFMGTIEQIGGDVAAARDLGADEVFFDVQFSPDVNSVDAMAMRMEQLREAAG